MQTADLAMSGARTWLLIVLALTAIFYTRCGGGSTTSAPQNNTAPSTTVTITITGSSGGLQHSTTANITMN